MQIRRKLFSVILALTIILSMAGIVSADTPRDADACIQQILNAYRYHQNAAGADIECLLYELSQTSPYRAQDWASIMDYWNYVNTDMVLYPDVLPDGLPQDDTLCIVVMGYALNADGTMKKELIGRLETALASAEKYPNAYIVCTGGGTAKNNKSRTEAGEMSKWLMEKGVDQDRIIVEDKAFSTVANAINTCKILANEFPLVTHLALVTSDYHLARSCLLFHAQATLTASKGAPLLRVAANAAYPTSRSNESIEIQADNLAQLTGISINGLPKPELSRLDHIDIINEVQYVPGEELDLQVMAYYNTGLYRDVSRYVEYAGLDFSAAGIQDVTVTYREDNIEVFTTFQIELPAPETEPPTLPPTEAATVPATQPETEPDATQPISVDNTPSGNWWMMPVAMIGTLLLAAFLLTALFLKVRNKQKISKSTVEESHAELPDDDSPVEYI